MARLFQEIIKTHFNGVFEKIIFAIFEDYNSYQIHNPTGNAAEFGKVFMKSGEVPSFPEDFEGEGRREEGEEGEEKGGEEADEKEEEGDEGEEDEKEAKVEGKEEGKVEEGKVEEKEKEADEGWDNKGEEVEEKKGDENF
jgi:hypothetical protein